ncbi:MAG: YlmC/YmxH family sporulation protein [Desulfitibacter sp. BRH_c19]|nr:MAG: YlmC/YmxH family sporulation protein [Desulfitibacter sp. BRH_c19]
MKLSDLLGKEIINIYDGARLGTIGDSDLMIDRDSGFVDSILLPNPNGFLRVFGERSTLTIPWEAIKKIGDQVIIVELDRTYHKMKLNS